MSFPGDPGYRPTPWGTSGDHDKRIRRLEALVASSGSGPMVFMELEEAGFTTLNGTNLVVPLVIHAQSAGIAYDDITGVWTFDTPGHYRIDVCMSVSHIDASTAIFFDSFVGSTDQHIHMVYQSDTSDTDEVVILVTSGIQYSDDFVLKFSASCIVTEMVVSVFGPFAAAI